VKGNDGVEMFLRFKESNSMSDLLMIYAAFSLEKQPKKGKEKGKEYTKQSVIKWEENQQDPIQMAEKFPYFLPFSCRR